MTMNPIVGAGAVNGAIRSAYKRGGLKEAQRIVTNLDSKHVLDICEGRAELTGDSNIGWGFRYLEGFTITG